MHGVRTFKSEIPDTLQTAFIAHFLHFSAESIYKMSFEEINYWYDEALELFKAMNPKPEAK